MKKSFENEGGVHRVDAYKSAFDRAIAFLSARVLRSCRLLEQGNVGETLFLAEL